MILLCAALLVASPAVSQGNPYLALPHAPEGWLLSVCAAWIVLRGSFPVCRLLQGPSWSSLRTLLWSGRPPRAERGPPFTGQVTSVHCPRVWKSSSARRADCKYWFQESCPRASYAAKNWCCGGDRAWPASSVLSAEGSQPVLVTDAGQLIPLNLTGIFLDYQKMWRYLRESAWWKH